MSVQTENSKWQKRTTARQSDTLQHNIIILWYSFSWNTMSHYFACHPPVMCRVYPSAACQPLSVPNVSVERNWRRRHHRDQHSGMPHLMTADIVLSNTQDLAVTGLFWTHQHRTNIHIKSIIHIFFTWTTHGQTTAIYLSSTTHCRKIRHGLFRKMLLKVCKMHVMCISNYWNSAAAELQSVVH